METDFFFSIFRRVFTLIAMKKLRRLQLNEVQKKKRLEGVALKNVIRTPQKNWFISMGMSFTITLLSVSQPIIILGACRMHGSFDKWVRNSNEKVQFIRRNTHTNSTINGTLARSPMEEGICCWWSVYQHQRIGCYFIFITGHHISRCQDYMLETGYIWMYVRCLFKCQINLELNNFYDRWSNPFCRYWMFFSGTLVFSNSN